MLLRSQRLTRLWSPCASCPQVPHLHMGTPPLVHTVVIPLWGMVHQPITPAMGTRLGLLRAMELPLRDTVPHPVMVHLPIMHLLDMEPMAPLLELGQHHLQWAGWRHRVDMTPTT